MRFTSIRFTCAMVVLAGGAFWMIGCDGGEPTGQSTPATPSETAPAAAAASGGESYPLDVCVVSGQKLGSMGDPVVIEHNGREVRFCCAGCIDSFKAEPAKYLAKLDAPGNHGEDKGHEQHGHNH